MKYIKIFLLLLITQNCTKAEKVKHLENIEKDERLTNIYIDLFIRDDIDDPKDLDVVHLRAFDGGKMNRNNTILLNNQPFQLVTRQSNYYIKYSQYVLSNHKKDEAYLVEIILADSSRHKLAYIEPRKDYKDLNYVVPKHFTYDENLELKWKNIYTPTSLNVEKEVYELKYQNATHLYTHLKNHEYCYEITKKNGSYIIDKSVFKDSLEVAIGIQASFSFREKARINPNLSSGSNFTFENKVLKKSIIKR